MPRAVLSLPLVLLSALALLTGCGGEPASRRLGAFPLDDVSEFPAGGAARIEQDPERGPVAFAASERTVKVPLFEAEVPRMASEVLCITGHFRVEMLDAAVGWQLRLENADGEIRFLQIQPDEYDRTHGWRPFLVEFALGGGEPPVRVTVAAILPPGRLWLDALELWDGRPSAAGASP